MTFYELHEGPMALQRFMRESVGAGLRERYKPEPEVPQELLALLAGMNHDKPPAQQAARQHLHPFR
jgi:hypothetical protein